MRPVKANSSLEDPFTLGFLELNSSFSSYFLLFIREHVDFPQAAHDFYAARVHTPEQGIENYEMIRKAALSGLVEIKEHPIFGSRLEELAVLEAKVHASLEKLESQYSALDWRKCFVQRHFVLAIGDMHINHVSVGVNRLPSVSKFFNELASLRDSIFEDSNSSNIAAYLAASSLTREQSDYRLRYESLERSAFSDFPPLDAIVALEDELSVRVLFEDATH